MDTTYIRNKNSMVSGLDMGVVRVEMQLPSRFFFLHTHHKNIQQKGGVENCKRENNSEFSPGNCNACRRRRIFASCPRMVLFLWCRSSIANIMALTKGLTPQISSPPLKEGGAIIFTKTFINRTRPLPCVQRDYI